MIYINDPNTGILLCNLNITPKVWTLGCILNIFVLENSESF